MFRQMSEEGVVNGEGFRSGGISESLEFDARQILSPKTAFSQSGVGAIKYVGFGRMRLTIRYATRI